MQPKEIKLTHTIKETSEISGIGREKITEVTFSNASGVKLRTVTRFR